MQSVQAVRIVVGDDRDVNMVCAAWVVINAMRDDHFVVHQPLHVFVHVPEIPPDVKVAASAEY